MTAMNSTVSILPAGEFGVPTILNFPYSCLEIIEGKVGRSLFQAVEIHYEKSRLKRADSEGWCCWECAWNYSNSASLEMRADRQRAKIPETWDILESRENTAKVYEFVSTQWEWMVCAISKQYNYLRYIMWLRQNMNSRGRMFTTARTSSWPLSI